MTNSPYFPVHWTDKELPVCDGIHNSNNTVIYPQWPIEHQERCEIGHNQNDEIIIGARWCERVTQSVTSVTVCEEMAVTCDAALSRGVTWSHAVTLLVSSSQSAVTNNTIISSQCPHRARQRQHISESQNDDHLPSPIFSSNLRYGRVSLLHPSVPLIQNLLKVLAMIDGAPALESVQLGSEKFSRWKMSRSRPDSPSSWLRRGGRWWISSRSESPGEDVKMMLDKRSNIFLNRRPLIYSIIFASETKDVLNVKCWHYNISNKSNNHFIVWWSLSED